MSSTLADDIGALRTALTGQLITPESPDYDEFRQVWNADHNGRPAVIALCESDADVAARLAK